MLAQLLLNRGRAVGIDALIDGVWGHAPPAGAVSVIRTYASRLRRLLEPERAPRDPFRILVSPGHGYALRTESVISDLDEFEEAVTEAGRSREAGDPRACERLLRGALASWTGPALPDVPGPYAQAVRGRLEEQRLSAQETCLRAGLELGRHERLVGELLALREAHPLREGVSELLLVALSRCGRKAEALKAYARTRDVIVRELGVEPGPALRDVRARLLADDPTLAPPARTGPAPAPDPPERSAGPRPVTVVQPSQLPADSPLFTGRRTDLARVSALLPADGAPSAPAVGVIDGMAGAGKTTLAVHWAHQVADRFPDGSLYVNLRGHDQHGAVMNPSEALQNFLAALAVAPDTVPESLDAQAALYRSVLAGRRILIVLDNARDTEQVRPLLPGTPGCLVIVTSRNRLAGLIAGHGAHPLTLDLPTAEDARAMLVRRLGETRVAAEPEAADAIVRLCARLPLALAIVAARAALHPGFRLADIAAGLRQDHGSLDAFTGGDSHTDARAVFSWSYHALPAEPARLFRLLSLHPGPDITTDAAGALLGVDSRRARTLLAQLTGTSLIVERAPGRFVFHDLLRAFAAELAETEDTGATGATGTTGTTGEDRRAALRRMHDHYLHTAHRACLVLGPFRETIAMPPGTSDCAPLPFRDKKQATVWLRAERDVLRAVVENAATHGFEDHAWRIAFALELFLDRLGFWHLLMDINRVALRSAIAAGDPNGQAHAHRALGFSHTRFGPRSEALAHMERALRLFRETGDELGQARTHRQFAFLANRRGAYDDALGHYEQARALYLNQGHRNGEGGVLNEVGWTYILRGEYERALEHCEKAVTLHRDIGDPNGEAAAQDSVGYAHHHLGHHDRALAAYGRALELYREIGDRYLEADTLRHIGDSHRAAARPDLARAAWHEALALLEEAGHPEAEELRTRLGRRSGPG